MREEGFVSGADDVRLTVEILVPSAQVGRIIGKGGQNVRELQRVTGSVIKLPEQGATPQEDETTVHIIGPFFSVQVSSTEKFKWRRDWNNVFANSPLNVEFALWCYSRQRHLLADVHRVSQKRAVVNHSRSSSNNPRAAPPNNNKPRPNNVHCLAHAHKSRIPLYYNISDRIGQDTSRGFSFKPHWDIYRRDVEVSGLSDKCESTSELRAYTMFTNLPQ